MAEQNNDLYIYGAVRAMTEEGKAAYAEQVYDEQAGRFQSDMNAEFREDISKLDRESKQDIQALDEGKVDNVAFTEYKDEVTETYGENKDIAEFAKVITDSEGRILEGTRPDGTKYFPKDVQAPNIARTEAAVSEITEQVERTEEKLSLGEVDGEMQYPSDIYGFLDTSEFIKVNLDMENRVLSGVRKDGTYYFSRLSADHLEMTRSMLEDFMKGAQENNLSLIDANIATSMESEESMEYLHVVKDADGRIIAAVSTDGSYVISKLIAKTINLDKTAVKQLEEMLTEDGFSPDISDLEDAIAANTSAIESLSGTVTDLSSQVTTSQSTIMGAATELVNQKTTNIEYSQLSQACKDSISGSQGGTITNNADEEDLTASGGALHFKDRDGTSGMAYVILRKNIDTNTGSPTYGKNILNPSWLDNKDNTIFVIQYDFDLYGQTITLGSNVILRFNGGAFKNTKQTNDAVDWATIKLNNTTVIDSDYWCFYNCKFTNKNTSSRYVDKFRLRWIGIQDDGQDKYPLFMKLYDMIGEILTGTSTSYKPNFTISGTILCNFNGIYIPTSMNLYGENEAVIQFSDNQGSYCVCISKQTSVHNIKFKHQRNINGVNDYAGAIVAIDSRLRNDDIALDPIGINVFENLSIEGTWLPNGGTCQCTGLSIIGSDEMYGSASNVSAYFRQIWCDFLYIHYTKIGLKIGLEKNYSVGPLVWGNGVVIDKAFIGASEKCVYCYQTHYGGVGNMSSYGRSRIGWLTGQAMKGDCHIIEIDMFNDFRIDNYMPYDTLSDAEGLAPVGFIRNGGSLKIGWDKAIAVSQQHQNTDFDAIQLDDNTEYRLYNGTLCRSGQVYRRTT